MTKYRQALGRWGEEQAAEYLRSDGYEILDTNARTAYGELDLVVRKPSPENINENELVFVEVKTRRSKSLGPPELSVNARKQAHLIFAAQSYLQEHPELGGDFRVDVISVELNRQDRSPEITHFQNVISELE